MPVVLTQEDHARWLDPDAAAEDLADLLAPVPNDLLQVVPLDNAVNSIRADGPGVLTAAAPVEIWPSA
jgi:putative SOS response-associated peptidase YedK